MSYQMVYKSVNWIFGCFKKHMVKNQLKSNTLMILCKTLLNNNLN